MVIQSFLPSIFKFIFLYQIYAPKIIAANKHRNHIVTGGGIEINRPKMPEVLTKRTATFNSAICFKCLLFKPPFFEVFLMLF